jgi:hypothetical protein
MKTLVWVFIGILIAGCSGQQMTDVQKAEMLANVPTCQSPEECELKWAAARNWILENLTRKIETITPDYIETHGTYGVSSFSSRDFISARVTKTPLGNGVYRFDLATACGRPFGCSPSPYEMGKSFIEALNKAGSQVARK